MSELDRIMRQMAAQGITVSTSARPGADSIAGRIQASAERDGNTIPCRNPRCSHTRAHDGPCLDSSAAPEQHDSEEADHGSYCGRGICAALEDHPGSCAAASGWADVYECPECDSCLASDRPIRIHHHGDLSHEVEYLSDPEPHDSEHGAGPLGSREKASVDTAVSGRTPGRQLGTEDQPSSAGRHPEPHVSGRMDAAPDMLSRGGSASVPRGE